MLLLRIAGFCLLAAPQAPAVPAPATAPPAFVHFFDGASFAEESVLLSEAEAGATIRGHVSGTLPGGIDLSIDHEDRLSKDRSRIVDYTATLRAKERTFTFRAAQTEKGWRLEAREGDGAPTAIEKEIAGPSVLLDNNLAEHLDVLARSLSLEPGATVTYTAVVPQVMQAVPLKVTRIPDATARVDGSEVPARRYRFETGSLLFDVTTRARDGGLLEAAIPLQKASYRARGYEPARAGESRDVREAEVIVPSPAGDLPAVLTRPAGDGPAPAALLLSGSGPNDRDETIGPNKPLRDLARGLADRGIASLRFDKRTVKLKDPSLASTLRDEYVTDALKAAEILATSPGIDRARLFVIGHSLGAAMAPVVAKESGAVRGVVLLAPPFRRADLMVLDQMAFQLRAAGTEPASIDAQIQTMRQTLDAIRTSAPSAPASFLGAPAPYWRDLLALDVGGSLRALPLPALVVQGEKDMQVKADLDFEPLHGSVGDGGGRFRFVRLPGLNHLFMKVEGDSTGAEYAIEGRMETAVIDTVADWVKGIGGARATRSGEPGT